jgi:hypothetical protein
MRYNGWLTRYNDILVKRIERLNEDEYDISIIEVYRPRIDFDNDLTPGEAAAAAIDSGYLGDGELFMEHSGEWGGEYTPD